MTECWRYEVVCGPCGFGFPDMGQRGLPEQCGVLLPLPDCPKCHKPLSIVWSRCNDA